jgi:hypothetical protein
MCCTRSVAEIIVGNSQSIKGNWQLLINQSINQSATCAGFVDQPLLDGDDGPQDSSGEHDVALAAVLLGLGRSGWLAGWLLVPVAVFWAGTCRWDFGHLVYLLLLLLRFLRHTLRLQPQAR